MRSRPGKLDVRYLAISFGILLVVVVASLLLFPEWRESPALIIVLIVATIVGVVGFAANFRAAFMPDRKDAAPAALDYDSPQHRRNQANVTANVRSSYIDGVLHQALGERVRLELALDDRPETLRRPMVLVEGQAVRRPLAGSAEVVEVFRRSGQALLILGVPGSGKTITLLELCEPLLQRAEADPREPVPVVLNLSTWAQRQPPLAEWIAEEMWRQYGLAKHVTPVWLAADHLVLLLDGLDEVRSDARDACVRAINAFRATHGAGMVVCSRSADYDELAERLALREAVEILPLDETQVAAYLGDERLGLGAVREAIKRDDALRELAQTPLMLSIIASAYSGRSLAELLPLLEDEAARRAHLYDAYIERAFKRRPLKGMGYSVVQGLHWLRFLAKQLTARDETQFFVEDLQPEWLPKQQRNWFRLLVDMVVGMLFGVTIGVMAGVVLGIAFGMAFGVLFSVFFGAVFDNQFVKGTPNITPVDKLRTDLSLQSVNQAIKHNIPAGVLSGVLGGVAFGVIGSNLRFGVLSGVLLGVLWVLLSVLDDLLLPLESKRRDHPNQGIRRSALNAVRAVAQYSVVSGTVVGIVLGVVFGVMSEATPVSTVFAALAGMLFGVFLGALFGILFSTIGSGGDKLGSMFVLGAEAVVKHYALRLLLHAKGLLPLHLVPFLEAMRDRILVQRAGAHYRFIHRTFQEHIATLTDEGIERLARD